ncbi:primase 2 domain protein [Burkholderia pseudomallei MSHR7343]|nr:primase 2 domain protein [Burkholderia pseudomallei MSHR7343]
MIGRRGLGRRPDRFGERRRGLLFLGQFGQLGRFAGRALGFLPLALRWIDRLGPMRARIEAAMLGEVKQRVDGDLAALERLPHIARVLAVVVLRALAPFVPEGEALLAKLGLERHPHLTPRVAVVGRDIAERDSRPLEFGHGCVTHRFPLDARRPTSD